MPATRPCIAVSAILAVMVGLSMVLGPEPAPSPAAPPPATEDVVTLTDGRVVRGRITNINGPLVIRSDGPARDVIVSPLLVSRKDRRPPAEPLLPEYLLNPDVPRTAKKGRVADIVENWTWGAWAEGGIVEVSCRDPVLKDVTFRMAVTRVNPWLVELQGVDLAKKFSVPYPALRAVVTPLLAKLVKENEPASLLTAVRFHRLASDPEAAEEWLAKLRAAGQAETPAFKAEAERVAALRVRVVLDDVRQLLRTRQVDAAVKRSEPLPPPAEADRMVPGATVLLGELTARRASVEAGRKLLDEKKHPGALAFTDRQVERLATLLGLGKPGAREVPTRFLSVLIEEWADVLAGVKWEVGTLGEAADLADEVGRFFARDFPEGTRDVAGKLERSGLPLEVKLAMVKHASRKSDKPFEDPSLQASGPAGWRKIEYAHPTLRVLCHYWVALPPGYRGSEARGLLVALHGEGATAEIMKDFWGETAARAGLILVSPEFALARKPGWQQTIPEQQAIVGALWHVGTRVNFDADRVFLTGHSAGGAACWDVGAAYAGNFAGVAPFIGRLSHGRVLPNFRDTALYVVDGATNGASPRTNRECLLELAKLRTDAIYVEHVGRGYEAYGEEHAAIGEWLATRRRPAMESVHLHALRTTEGRRRFVELTSTSLPFPNPPTPNGPSAKLEGKVLPGNRIELHATNVATLRAYVPMAGTDWTKPVTISVNDIVQFREVLRPDWGVALEDCLLRRDRRDVFGARVEIDLRVNGRLP